MPGSRFVLQDRVEIQVGIAKNMSDGAIGSVVSKNRTTVLREIRAGGGRPGYCAETAHARAARNARRPKQLRLATEVVLRGEVEEGLAKRWSPASISMATGRRVCAETIYRAVYAGRSGPLSVDACRRLVSKRRARRPRQPKTTAKRNVLGLIRPVSTRPAAAGLRRPGHWEGDLIVGSMNRSAIVTLACRASRYTLLADLPEGHGAPEVTAALVELFRSGPGPSAFDADLGPGPRDGRLGRHRSPRRRAHDLLLRSALPVAAAHERERQQQSCAAGCPRAPTSTPTPGKISIVSKTT